MPKPSMILIAGINGAGKTTLYYNQIKPFLESKGEQIPFVNADELEKANKYENSYIAAQKAAELRDEYFKNKQSFVTETVFSHPSKNELITKAQDNGFKVILNHVHVDDSKKAFMRVQTRVSLGGHAVPEEKVHGRFPRTVENIKKAVKQADLAYVWDNNQGKQIGKVSHRFVMTMAKGEITKLAPNVPNWANKMYSEQIEKFTNKKKAVIDKAIKTLAADSTNKSKAAVASSLKKAGVNELEFKRAVQKNEYKPAKKAGKDKDSGLEP